MDKKYTLELTTDEYKLLKTYVPSITLQGVTAKDAIAISNIILGLGAKLEKLDLPPEENKGESTNVN